MSQNKEKAKSDENVRQNGARKSEVASACLGTGVLVNIVFCLIAAIFSADPGRLIGFYFEKYVFILVMAVIFIVFWPFYSKRLKRSNALW